MKINFKVGDLLHIENNLYYITEKSRDELTLISLLDGDKQFWRDNTIQWWFSSSVYNTTRYPVVKTIRKKEE
jgi:hypothetical protein